jgi:3-hydroxyacyl-[acyl-carrier-protein] dehydratase
VNREAILELLPHRDPFVMVDEVVEIDPERIVALKHVRDDEDWCRGHFPGNPILPGVLITEAMAQAAALIYLHANRDRAGSTVYLVGADKLRFRKPVRPGETLRLEVAVTGQRRGMWTFDATASVDGTRVANGTFMATVAQAE